MPIQRPFPIKKWIDEHRHLLKPPVGNKVVWEDADFIVMVVGGPNARKDYHFNTGEEFFYQIEGDVAVTIQENGKAVEIPIREGDVFLLPPQVPHSPRRGPNTVGLVIERRRGSEEEDGLLWFCEQCNNLLYEAYFPMKNIETAFKTTFDHFYGSRELRTCASCSHVMEPPTPPKP
jgi:3-hydroxyanthranilate 3,4-dioxygenase